MIAVRVLCVLGFVVSASSLARWLVYLLTVLGAYGSKPMSIYASDAGAVRNAFMYVAVLCAWMIACVQLFAFSNVIAHRLSGKLVRSKPR